MNKFLKSKVFIFVFFAVIVITSCVQIASFATQSKLANTDETPTTSLQVKVVSFDGTPLRYANVTVIETQKTYLTDASGYTPLIQVPYNHTPLCDVTDGEFSFVNLVVTCDGYKDSILYNCLVYKNRTRQGPMIMMFGKNQTTAPYVVTTEVPPDKWTKEFLKKIKENQ